VDGYETAIRIAGPREAGARCPACSRPVADGDPVTVCPSCGSAHHHSCWEQGGRCGSYECAPARRDLARESTPALHISTDELAAVVPLPSVPVVRAASLVPPSPIRPRTSGLAIAAFVTAIVGIPLFGLVTGPVAVILGCIALGGLTARGQKGLTFALVGVLLGLLDFGGWAGLMYYAFYVHERAPISLADFQPDPTALTGLAPPINRAMRANVLIHVTGGWGGDALGSGVILRIADGSALVLTNQHVADQKNAGPAGDNGGLTVQLIGQPTMPGRLVWVAPPGIDLAVVRVPCTTGEAMTARWKANPVVKIGDPVFAVGNPLGLGWTHTTGTVSQFRVQEHGAHKLRVIQTQTAVNPGNSGGGLYATDGTLIGIVTWKQDERTGQGLNFAISVDDLPDLLPPDLLPDPNAR
jgi:hypothetical protein